MENKFLIQQLIDISKGENQAAAVTAIKTLLKMDVDVDEFIADSEAKPTTAIEGDTPLFSTEFLKSVANS